MSKGRKTNDKNRTIDPILVTLGHFPISWHGLLMAVAIWVGVWLPARLTTKAWLSMDRLYSMALWGVPGGIISARLVHVIDYWSYYSANPGTILTFWEGGLAIWGGVSRGVRLPP